MSVSTTPTARPAQALGALPEALHGCITPFADLQSCGRFACVSKAAKAVIDKTGALPHVNLINKKFSAREFQRTVPFHCFAYDPQTQQVITGDYSDDHAPRGRLGQRIGIKARIWTTDGTQLRALPSSTSFWKPITRVAWDPQHNRAVACSSSSDSRTLIASQKGERLTAIDSYPNFHYDPDTEELLHSSGVALRSFSSADNYVATQTEFPDSNFEMHWIGKDDSIDRVFAYSQNKGLKIWSRNPPQCIAHFPRAYSFNKSISYDKTTHSLFINQNGKIDIVDAITGEIRESIDAGQGIVTAIHFDPQTRKVFVANDYIGSQGQKCVKITIWFPNGKKFSFEISGKYRPEVSQIDFDGNVIMTASQRGVQILSEEGQLLREITPGGNPRFVWDKKGKKIIIHNEYYYPGPNQGTLTVIDYDGDKPAKESKESKRS